MLVDTNVLSQLTRRSGDAGVIEWLRHNFDGISVPSLVASEMLYGAYRLSDPIQRNHLVDVTEALLKSCAGKFIAFDGDDAMLHGRLSGEAVRFGNTRPASDSMIAAMAIIRRLPVATRNVRHFEGLGLEIVNPWSA